MKGQRLIKLKFDNFDPENAHSKLKKTLENIKNDIKEMEDWLNKLYWSDKYRYQNYLEKVKAAGYKVMRNTKGQHIIKGSFNDLFGDLFGNIF